MPTLRTELPADPLDLVNLVDPAMISNKLGLGVEKTTVLALSHHQLEGDLRFQHNC